MSEETEEKTKTGINWTSEKIMSISALFVSAISLFALFYQLNLAHQENELIRKQQSASVLPYLQFESIYSVRSFRINFVNKGVGPAFIKKVSFSINDTLNFDNSTSALLHIIKKEVNNGNSIGYNGSNTIKENTVIQPSESVRFFEISYKSDNDFSGVESFKNYMNNTPPLFTIIYEDVYGNQWELSNRSNRQDFQFLTPMLIKKVE